MVGLGESWAQSQVCVAGGLMRVNVDSPSYREEPCNHGCRNLAGSWGTGGGVHLGSNAHVSPYHQAGCASL